MGPGGADPRPKVVAASTSLRTVHRVLDRQLLSDRAAPRIADHVDLGVAELAQQHTGEQCVTGHRRRPPRQGRPAGAGEVEHDDLPVRQLPKSAGPTCPGCHRSPSAAAPAVRSRLSGYAPGSVRRTRRTARRTCRSLGEPRAKNFPCRTCRSRGLRDVVHELDPVGAVAPARRTPCVPGCTPHIGYLDLGARTDDDARQRAF